MFRSQIRERLSQNTSLFIGEDTAFRSAVLIPLVQVDEEWHVLFEVRSSKMRSQPGDICFPGGRIDDTDSSPLAAALRETTEELGIDPNGVDIVGHLSPYIASPSFVVYPFVGIVEYDETIHSYNREEVEEVFTVPVKWLMEYGPYMHSVSVNLVPPTDFPFDKIINGAEYQWRTHSMDEWFFDYGKYTIWGITARILKHFIEMMKREG